MRLRALRAKRLAVSAAVVSCGGVLAATAFAIPVREGTISASSPVYEWDGGPGNGSGQGVGATRCTPVFYECEDSLVELKDAGDLVAEVKAGANANDLDVAIYKSDADGTVPSDPPADGDEPEVEDISTGANAKTTLKKAQPGFYIVRVRTFDGIQATWKGSATLKLPPPPVPPPPPPPPAVTPPQPAKPTAAQRRAACRKKAKKIKNKRKRSKALKRCKKIR